MIDPQADDAGNAGPNPTIPHKTFADDATPEEVRKWVQEQLEKEPDPQPEGPPG